MPREKHFEPRSAIAPRDRGCGSLGWGDGVRRPTLFDDRERLAGGLRGEPLDSIIRR